MGGDPHSSKTICPNYHDDYDDNDSDDGMVIIMMMMMDWLHTKDSTDDNCEKVMRILTFSNFCDVLLLLLLLLLSTKIVVYFTQIQLSGRANPITTREQK